MPERPYILTAAAGEHYVAFQLSARGFTVGIPRANTPGVDLLVSNQSGTKTLAIQVKTSGSAKRESMRSPENTHWEWDVGPRSRALRGDRLFYVLVDLRWGSDKPPMVFIVPSEVIQRDMDIDTKRYRWWLYERDAASYLDRWDLLEEKLRD